MRFSGKRRNRYLSKQDKDSGYEEVKVSSAVRSGEIRCRNNFCVVSGENRRTSARSRVTFSKLTPEEKEQRCANLAKEVKELRRQLRRRADTAQ